MDPTGMLAVAKISTCIANNSSELTGCDREIKDKRYTDPQHSPDEAAISTGIADKNTGTR